MGREFYITRTNYESMLKMYADEMLEECQCVMVTMEDPKAKDSGRWTMSRLWRSWMESTAEWMADHGSRMPVRAEINGKPTKMFFRPDAVITDWRPFDKNDAHECFTIEYLGTDSQGNRYSWTKNKQPGSAWADKGMRLTAMQKHQVWMLERGIKFMDPAESEFRQLCEDYGIN